MTKGNWVQVEMPALAELPATPACYAIYCDGRLVYIGQTTNLKHRITSYSFQFARYSDSIKHPWGGHCKNLNVKYRLSRKFGDWAMYELRLIKRLQPVFNIAGTPRNKRKTRTIEIGQEI